MHRKWVSALIIIAVSFPFVASAPGLSSFHGGSLNLVSLPEEPESNFPTSNIPKSLGSDKFNSFQYGTNTDNSTNRKWCDSDRDCDMELCRKMACTCIENTCTPEPPFERPMENVVIVLIIAVSISMLICIFAAVYRRFFQRVPSVGRRNVSLIPTPTPSRNSFIQELSTIDTPPSYDVLFLSDSKLCFDPPSYIECTQKIQSGFCLCNYNTRSSPRPHSFDHQATVHSLSELDHQATVHSLTGFHGMPYVNVRL